MKNLTVEFIKNNWSYKNNILNFDDFFKASILIPLCEIDGNLYIIFEKRATNIKQGDEICFPGGKYEKTDSNFSYTALRETSEELGIGIDRISIIHELDTLISPFNSIIYSFLGFIEASSFNDFNINLDEVQKLLFIPLDWFLNQKPEIYKIYHESHPHTFDINGNKINTFPAKSFGLPDKYHTSWSNGFRDIFLYKYENEIIWGFTAAILKDFIDKYNKL